ncbi:MAG: hypothetical protein KGL39_48145 [Patescibacteria group bacterium]|nr:hypothetical protein [Patescibacteria group bacterium]
MTDTNLIDAIARATLAASRLAFEASHERKTVGDIRNEIAAVYLSALSEVGYVVVPKEPTKAMIDAADKFDVTWKYSNFCDPGSPADVYRAMLAEVDKT